MNSFMLRAVAIATTLSPATALAQFGPSPDVAGLVAEDQLRSSVESVVKTILSFLALIAVIVIIIAGIRLVLSQGEDEAKDSAKKTIFYAIIGLIVLLFARAIVGFVTDAVVSNMP